MVAGAAEGGDAAVGDCGDCLRVIDRRPSMEKAAALAKTHSLQASMTAAKPGSL